MIPEIIDFSRVEPLGDNCELGFVMRKLGYEGGSFFRWVAVHREGVKSLIENDFQLAFQFESLKAHPGNMVMDTAFGAAYHTDMHSVPDNDKLVFIDDEATLREKHSNELKKVRYLADRFRSNLGVDGILYVTKSSGVTNERDFDKLFECLQGCRQGGHFDLLQVLISPSPELVGTVARTGKNRLVGYVGYFAPFNKTYDSDLTAWMSILGSAFESDH
jgi:hypothetical protein